MPCVPGVHATRAVVERYMLVFEALAATLASVGCAQDWTIHRHSVPLSAVFEPSVGRSQGIFDPKTADPPSSGVLN